MQPVHHQLTLLPGRQNFSRETIQINSWEPMLSKITPELTSILSFAVMDYSQTNPSGQGMGRYNSRYTANAMDPSTPGYDSNWSAVSQSGGGRQGT